MHEPSTNTMFPPVQWLFKVSGLSPNHAIHNKFFALAATACIFLGGNSAVNVYLKINTSHECTASCFFTILDVLYCLSGIFFSIKVHLTKHRFVALYQNCILSEEENHEHGFPTKRFEQLSVLVYCLVLFSRVVFRTLDTSLHTQKVVYDVGMAFLYIPCLMHILMVHHLKVKFSTLNLKLKEISEIIKDAPDYVPTDLKYNILKLFRAHVHLREIQSRLNSYFGVYNAIVFFIRGFFIIHLMYYILLWFSNPEMTMTFTAILAFSSLLIALVTQCDVCYNCSEQAKETVRIAYEMVDWVTPVDILELIADFSLTMFNNPVSFTASGILTLNRGLLTKTTVATVTCLIIAVQLTDIKVPDPKYVTNTTNEYISPGYNFTLSPGHFSLQD